MTCKRQLEEHTDQIGLKKEDAIDRAKWRDGVHELSRRIRRIWPPALTQKKTGFKKVDLSLSLSLLVLKRQCKLEMSALLPLKTSSKYLDLEPENSDWQP